MKNHIFSKSIQILIVAVLAALALFKNQWIAIAVMVVWLLFLVGRLVFIKRRRIARRLTKLVPQPHPHAQTETQETPLPNMVEVPEVFDPPSVVLLRHLNCRISDKLKSAYPDVTWSWEAEQPEKIAMTGGTGRITLHQAGEFTHAEVTLDQLARIEFKMIKMVDINALITGTNPKTGAPAVETATTDAAAWFDLVGREQLTAIVTELNTRNHRKLTIAENGDVYVVEDDASVKQGNLDNLPGKNFWNELGTLITKIGINAQVAGNQLRLTW